MLLSPILPPTSDALTHFEAQALLLEDPQAPSAGRGAASARPRPDERALDLVSETALEDFSGPDLRGPDRRLPLRRPAHRARRRQGPRHAQRPDPGLRRVGDPRHRDPGSHPQGAGGGCRHPGPGDHPRRRRGQLHDLDRRGLEPLEGLGEGLPHHRRPDRRARSAAGLQGPQTYRRLPGRDDRRLSGRPPRPTRPRTPAGSSTP